MDGTTTWTAAPTQPGLPARPPHAERTDHRRECSGECCLCIPPDIESRQWLLDWLPVGRFDAHERPSTELLQTATPLRDGLLQNEVTADIEAPRLADALSKLDERLDRMEHRARVYFTYLFFFVVMIWFNTELDNGNKDYGWLTGWLWLLLYYMAWNRNSKRSVKNSWMCWGRLLLISYVIVPIVCLIIGIQLFLWWIAAESEKAKKND